METNLDPRLIEAMLSWQTELGADEFIGDGPVDRFAHAEAMAAEAAARAAAGPVAGSAPAPAPARRTPDAPAPARPPAVDPVAVARAMAAGADTLADLARVMGDFPHCELRRGARRTVFGQGLEDARVMIIGDAPRADEDRQGLPFAGPEGALLDRMLAAIGLDRHAEDRARAVRLAAVLPWRAPGDRDPDPAEMAMMLPFLARQVALVAPDVVVLMGNQACQAILGRPGILRLRGQWGECFDRPCLPMLHPAHLLRNPGAKREAWADLLSLQARLRTS